MTSSSPWRCRDFRCQLAVVWLALPSAAAISGWEGGYPWSRRYCRMNCRTSPARFEGLVAWRGWVDRSRPHRSGLSLGLALGRLHVVFSGWFVRVGLTWEEIAVYSLVCRNELLLRLLTSTSRHTPLPTSSTFRHTPPPTSSTSRHTPFPATRKLRSHCGAGGSALATGFGTTERWRKEMRCTASRTT